MNNWLDDAVTTTQHIKQQDEVGYFFEKDIEVLINALNQARLQCKMIDDNFVLNLLPE